MLAKNTTAQGEILPYKSLQPLRVLLIIAYFAVAIWYLHYRLETFNTGTTFSTVFSYTLYGAEIFGFFVTLLHLFMVWRLSERKAPAARPGHTVDVFIPTINEPISIVRRTALTALNMEYPHTVYILDDGNRAEVKQMADELGCKYLARGSNEDAKAGNLNHALQQSNGEFVAIFDADHAPKKTFLSQTLGYFEDPKVAFIQTPQDFYNLDSYQHRGRAKEGSIWSEQSLFFRIIQRGKDFWNAAFFCGSCAVVRRSVLNEIGGFATGTVTEDLHTSIRIHKAGYKSVYHSEPLAFGIAASQIEPFLNQRIRWGQGAMQVWKKEGVLFARGLTFAQRLNYMASMITYFDGWQKLILYVAPAIVLTTGVLPILNLEWEFLIHFIPFFLMTFWVFEEAGRGYGKSLAIEQYNMARYAAFAWSTLGLFGMGRRFKVTNKTNGHHTGFNWLLIPQYAIFLLNTVAIPIGTLLYFTTSHIEFHVLVANSLWAIINLAMASAVLVFTIVRAGYLRQNYRFAIPLVMKILVRGKMEEPAFGAVDDISSSGFLVMSDISNVKLREGDVVEGELYLPTGALPFRARVTPQQSMMKDSNIRMLGCEFIWQSNKDKDQLELFLYGSDLEWRIQQINEQIRTPIEFVFGKYEEPHYVLPQAEHWSSALCKEETGGKIQSGVVTLDADVQRRNLVVFSPIAVGSKVEASVFTRSGWKTLRGTLVKEDRTTHTDEPNLYVYQLDQKLAARV